MKKNETTELEQKVNEELENSANSMCESVESIRSELKAFCEIHSINSANSMKSILLHTQASKIDKELIRVYEMLQKLIDNIYDKKRKYR